MSPKFKSKMCSLLSFCLLASQVMLEVRNEQTGTMKCICDGNCERVEESECPWGLTLDVCACCFICARGENEPCGGPLGTCAFGLNCHFVDKNLTDSAGTCTRSNDNCTNTERFGCVVHSGQCVCQKWFGCSQQEMFLFENEEACKSRVSFIFSHHQNLRNSNSTEVADKNNACSGVKCEASSKCPPDSHRNPVVLNEDGSIGCCPEASTCQCNPASVCHEPECPFGSISIIGKNGTGQPGHCCPIYKCAEVERKQGTDLVQDCVFLHKKYHSGDSWIHYEDCTQCSCNNGISACKAVICDYPNGCSRIVKPVSPAISGSCCPICADCISKSGQVYNDSEIWEEDSCTMCKCNDGRKQCHSMTCHSNCLQPKFVEGECCPICDNNGNDDKLTNSCPSLLNCPVEECEHGVKLDSRGCPSCECSKCPSLVNCSKTCPSGYENEDGCAVCKCIENDQNLCDDLHAHGEEWFDGCRECICKFGMELCSLLTCPAPTCQHPILHQGECCPRCTDFNTKDSTKTTTLNCKSSDGRVHLESELWRVGPCLNCTCHFGQILCASLKCAPTPCNQTVLTDGCCATCPETELLTSPLNSNCFSDDTETIYRNGEMWKVGECQSCVCVDGQIDCYSGEKCTRTVCENPVLLKSQCCPICLEFGVNELARNTSITNTQLQNDPDSKNHRLGLEPHCIVIIATLVTLTFVLTVYIIRGWLTRKRKRPRGGGLKSSIIVRPSPSLLPTPTPPVTPNYNCCYKYYPNCGQLSEQKTPLCSTLPTSPSERYNVSESATTTNVEKV